MPLQGGRFPHDQVLRGRMGKHNVRVNCVAPTFFRTDGTAEALADPAFAANVVERIAALHRIGEPHEVAGAVAFLCSDAAGMITGHTLLIDGGWTARLCVPANAATLDGNFMRGGGIGGVGCPAFLNDMATARSFGSLMDIEAVLHLNGYYQYLTGFQTAFNMEAEGVFDIFGAPSFGSWPTQSALIAIEPYCQNHPEALFDGALLWLVEKLRPGATVE